MNAIADVTVTRTSGIVERTGNHLMLRWRVRYPGSPDGGMDTESLHFTRLGARLSRWVWR